MSRPSSAAEAAFPDQLHARLLDGFAALVAELGGDPRAITRGVRLGPADADGSYRATIALLEAAAGALERPDIGMRLARRQGGGCLGPLSRVMRQSRTLAEALAYVAGHSQAHNVAARIWIERRPTEGEVFVGHDILLPGVPARTQAIEQIMLLGHLGAVEMTAGASRARRVHFRHRPLSPPAVYRRHFGCDIRFEQAEDGIVFYGRDLVQPVVDTDTNAGAYKAAVADVEARFPPADRPVHVEARGHVMRLLGTGPCDTAAVAARLAFHPRTLHRRLEAEGTSFQRVKDEVRRDVMLYYLVGTRLDLSTIAGRLGFAEQAVMTRFCQKLLGAAPSVVRRRGRNLS